MEQSFIKTIRGHTLEFNRLLYPLSYNILSQEFETPGTMICVQKDSKEMWNIKSLESLPKWVSEVTPEIYNAIKENETSVTAK